MDNNDKSDDFLGESIDDIFDGQFDANKSKKKNDGHETFIIDDDPLSEDENGIDDEDDIYVLEDPGDDIVTMPKQVEEIEENNFPKTENIDSSTPDLGDDFELLEKEFESVESEDIKYSTIDESSDELENSGNDSFNDDDPLDLDNEFVNMKPPEEVKKEDNDLDEFVLESHQYDAEDSTPPPIPSDQTNESEFGLSEDIEDENSVVSSNSEYSASVLEGGMNESSAMDDSQDFNDQNKTDGRFFDSHGKPINDAEILKSESNKLRSKKPDGSDQKSGSLKRALDRAENRYMSPMPDFKKGNVFQEKKNLIIGGVVLLIIVIAVIFFILPTFFGNPAPVQKKTEVVNALKNNSLIAKKKAKKKKKRVTDQEKINKLFAEAKNSFENGELEKAKELCREAISIKSSDALLFLEREINEKIESIKKNERIRNLEREDNDDYDRAIARDTVAAFENYLKKHPDGKYFGSAKSMINKLIKRNYQQKLDQIISKANSLNRIKLRSKGAKINKIAIQKILGSIRVQNNFEIQTIDGDRVIIDYSTGLMWIVAKYKMKFEKAKIWAVRHYAGYYNWRFPTAEEVLTLSGISPSYLQRSTLNGFNLWTKDRDIDTSHNWIFNLRDRSFNSSKTFDSHNLLSVRTIK